MYNKNGQLIVHTGGMYSGKTSALIEDLKRFKIAGKKAVLFRPSIDTRYSEKYVTNHDGTITMEAVYVNNLKDIYGYINDYDVIGIDEFQFFNYSKEKKDDLAEQYSIACFLKKLLFEGKVIVIAGLDMDFKSNPFRNMQTAMYLATSLTKHHAVCIECGKDAWISHKIMQDDNIIDIGATDKYIPLCVDCYKNKLRKE